MGAVLDRRRARHPRFLLRIPALVEPVAPAASLSAGFLKNLSRGGLLLQMRQQASCDSCVRVTLRLHHRAALTLTGTIKWNRPLHETTWEVGIQLSQKLPTGLVAAILAEETHPEAYEPPELSRI